MTGHRSQSLRANIWTTTWLLDKPPVVVFLTCLWLLTSEGKSLENISVLFYAMRYILWLLISFLYLLFSTVWLWSVWLWFHWSLSSLSFLTSWICKFALFINLGKFSAIIFQILFSLPIFSYHLPCYFEIVVYISGALVIAHLFWILFSLYCLDWIISINLF